MEYRIMIHPAGEVEEVIMPQLKTIAHQVYGKDTEEVVFRIKTLPAYTNRRKIFIPGNGEIVDIHVLPHITLSQKIEIEDDQEYVLDEKMKKITSRKPFFLQTSYLGDYGQDFTIFLAFGDSRETDNLNDAIAKEFGIYYSKDKETRDVLHTTLMYDDENVENFKKARTLINRNELTGKKFLVDSLWLWKGLSPYKKFVLNHHSKSA